MEAKDVLQPDLDLFKNIKCFVKWAKLKVSVSSGVNHLNL